MNNYILFIDTETSDMPQHWEAPTNQVNKWPYILQVAWTICTNKGENVLTRNFFINPGDINMGEQAEKLHGITLDFLKKNGIKRKQVLQKLTEDLTQFQPLVVGHFLKYDLKMLDVSYNRSHLESNLFSLPKFCTMFNTRSIFLGLNSRLLRLNELYHSLFRKDLLNQHNALVDANATRDCFFELLKRGEINDKIISKQKKYFKGDGNFTLLKKVVIPIMIAIITIFVIYMLMTAI